jgi:hypothetical protein
VEITHKKFTHISVIVVRDKTDGGRDHHEKYQTQLQTCSLKIQGRTDNVLYSPKVYNFIFIKAQILRNNNYTDQLFLKTDCDESDNRSELGEHCSS